jgi:hypothetical protein
MILISFLMKILPSLQAKRMPLALVRRGFQLFEINCEMSQWRSLSIPPIPSIVRFSSKALVF